MNRVLIYLQQELPEDYRGHLKLTGEKLIVTIPDSENFDQIFGILHQIIAGSINRIRNREIDLEFTIRSKNQERDFIIRK